MGVLYRIKCKACKGRFVRSVGSTVLGSCLRCEQMELVEDKFVCPICSAPLNPQSEEFKQQVESVEHWD